MIVALAMKAEIGDVSRFDEPQKIVSYLGLNTESGNLDQGLPTTGGSPNRAVDERAACSLKRLGQRHAHEDRCGLSSRISARSGQHVAAVATARKLAVDHLAPPDRGPKLCLGKAVSA